MGQLHLPWVQLTSDVIHLAVPDIAVRLDDEEGRIGWNVVRMLDWAVKRCPDDRPPSQSAVVEGPLAARLIARAAGYPGNADAFVDACAQSRPAILERVENGIRFRGLDRYDATWRKNNPEAAKARASPESARVPPENRAETGREPGESGTVSDRQNQKKNQKEKKGGGEVVVKEESEAEFFSPPPPPPPTPLPTSRGPAARWVGDVIEWDASADGCWDFIQLVREVNRLPREATRPKGFDSWARNALAEVGQDGIHGVLVAYLGDKTIRAPGHPTGVFIGGVWDVRRPPPRFDYPEASA